MDVLSNTSSMTAGCVCWGGWRWHFLPYSKSLYTCEPALSQEQGKHLCTTFTTRVLSERGQGARAGVACQQCNERRLLYVRVCAACSSRCPSLQ